MNRSFKFLVVLPLLTLFTPFAHANLIANGGFESGSFVNQGSNYMRLNPGNTALAGWTIDSIVAWGVNPTDGFSASEGVAFVDLSGFGAESPTGAISQLVTTVVGGSYVFAMNSWGGASAVFMNGVSLGLTPGATLAGWTTFTGVYSATSANTTISIRNASTSATVFIDRLSLEGGVAAVPEPATLGLLGAGLAGLAMARRKRAQRV